MKKVKADIGTTDYHMKFVHAANINYMKENKKLRSIIDSKNELYNSLKTDLEDIKLLLNLNLSQYDEFINNTYSEKEELIKDADKLFNNETENRKYIITIVKYCKALKDELNSKVIVEKYDKERRMGLREFEHIVSIFFYKVHEQMLHGDAYDLGGGLGQIYIERVENKSYDTVVDYQATRKRKQFLIDNGYKIYNKREQELAEQMGVKYDGIDYRVRLQNKYIDKITIDNSKYFSNGKQTNIKYIDYYGPELRIGGYDKIIEEYKTLKELYNLRLSIKRKLTVILLKFPEHGINYIRR